MVRESIREGMRNLMYESFLFLLKCPICESTSLSVQSFKGTEDQIHYGNIHCSVCKMKFPIIDGIPLLVDTSKQKDITKNWNISSEYTGYTLESTKQVSKILQKYSRDTMIALDAGCGSGAYTPFFNSNEIICLDLVPFFLKKLMNEYNGNSKLHVVIADVRRLPFKEKTVDLLFCSSVLEHLKKEDFTNVINNFSNICKKVTLVDVPNDSSKVVSSFRNIFEKLGFYKGRRVETISDEKLKHNCQLGMNDLKSMNFDVHGCIGWVSMKNIKIGLLWDLYDFIVWSHPSLGSTLIGIKRVD